MASMALSSLAAASPKMLRKELSNSSVVGVGSSALSLLKALTSTPKLSFAVKAQQYESTDPLHPSSYKDFKDLPPLVEGHDVLETTRFELTPWDYKEETGMIKMWFNMPGVAAQDIRIYVKDHKLFVQGKHLHLPNNIIKEDIRAKLGNGVLYVAVPKTKPDYEPLTIRVEAVPW